MIYFSISVMMNQHFCFQNLPQLILRWNITIIWSRFWFHILTDVNIIHLIFVVITVVIWVSNSPYWYEDYNPNFVYHLSEHYLNWLVSLLITSFVHQMIVSPYNTNVTAYLQWVEYQTNFLNVWNSISYHQEIATIS